MELYDNSSIYFTNNYYDSGSGFVNESEKIIKNNDTYTINNGNGLSIGVLLALSPLIFAGCSIILILLYFNIYMEIKDYIKSCKNKYNIHKEKKTLPIYNKKLNPLFVKELNVNNIKKFQNTDRQCSICFETIDFKKDKIILNCLHVYHTKCLNLWVKQKLNSFTTPDCPMCRNEIITPRPIKNNINNSSDSSGYDTDDLYS
jgi:hypothetical protein